eukprot:11827860-Ditylum_brightwellii.AAC.2
MDRKHIAIKQKEDPGLAALKAHYMQGKCFGSKIERGVKLVIFNDKIWMPDELAEGILDWYHENLDHLGCKGMIEAVGKNNCQHFKITGEEEKDDARPWQIIHVDTVGPWTVKFKLKKSEVIQMVEIITLTAAVWVTHWPEILSLKDQTARLTALTFDMK